MYGIYFNVIEQVENEESDEVGDVNDAENQDDKNEQDEQDEDEVTDTQVNNYGKKFPKNFCLEFVLLPHEWKLSPHLQGTIVNTK